MVEDEFEIVRVRPLLNQGRNPSGDAGDNII